MPVFLDEVAVELEGGQLGELIAAAQQRLEPSGRIIIEVAVEGDAIVGDALSQRQDEALAGRTLKLYSADPRELTLTLLEQVRAELDPLRKMQADAAELLQQDQPADALKQLGEAMGVWLQAQQAVLHAAQVMKVDLDNLVVDDRTLASHVEQLRVQLEEVKTLIVGGDTVGLADALAYEWPDTIDAWDRLIAKLADTIESTSTPPEAR